MKILVVSHEFHPKFGGGVWVYIHDLLQGLNDKGHKVFVFCRDEGIFNNKLTWKESRLGVIQIRTIYYNGPRNYITTYKNNDIDDAFGAYADEIRPDVIHVHHLMNLSGNIISLAKSRGIPVVTTLHDFWFICHGTYLIQSNGQKCPRLGKSRQCPNCRTESVEAYIHFPTHRMAHWRTKIGGFLVKYKGSYHLSNWIIRLFKPFAKLAPYRESDATCVSPISRAASSNRNAYLMHCLVESDFLIAPSQFIKARFVQSGVPSNKIHIIPHGLKIPVDKTPLRKRPPNGLRFAFVGAVHALKGIEVLLKAFSQIGHGGAGLNIYGIGNRDYIAFLKKSIPKKKNVRFHGPIRHAMISKVLGQNDVLVIPSICLESFSIVAREAFYSGLPVIASNCGALPEAVTDGVNGLLFDAGDTRQLARQMSRLMADSKLFEKLKSNLPPVKSIQCHADELISIYRHLSSG